MIGGGREVTVERDLAYASVDGAELRLDIYRPDEPDTPVVVYAHGGGWTRGDKNADGAKRLAPLAGHGVTVVSVDYRLAPSAVFPQQLHDLKGALRWLRTHGARLGLATGRLGIWGASAGAYLGSLLALSAGDSALEGAVGGNLEQSRAVQAVVHWFDFICPYCYIAQDRNRILREREIHVIEHPLQIHPEIGPGGTPAGPRSGSAYDFLAGEAEAAGLPLRWTERIPYSRPALAAFEWLRNTDPETSERFAAAVSRATSPIAWTSSRTTSWCKAGRRGRRRRERASRRIGFGRGKRGVDPG